MDDSNDNDNWKSKTCYKDKTSSHKETGWAFNPNEDPDDPDCYDPCED